MTDEELLNILENGGQISVPYFDGELVSIESCDASVSVTSALDALKGFLTLTPKQRQSDGRHLLAYCKMMIDAVGEEILEDMGGVEPNIEQIWKHAEIRHIFFSKLEMGKYASQTTVYVQIEGEVAWEPEHGLQMSWANGTQLVKVGEFDGHPTNGHASADTKNDQYIFQCYQKELCTLPDAS